jgi:radical SAM superfamily enzyme YgiQ (UPF0313 family)
MNRQSPAQLLLINPWIYDFAAYDYWAKPLGFLYLASLLRKLGYEIAYIDCLVDSYGSNVDTEHRNVLSRAKDGKGKFSKTKIRKPEALKTIPRNYSCYGMRRDKFLEKLNAVSPPEAVLVTSSMTYWYPGVFEVIRLVKTAFPGTPVILGGIYATLCRDHAEKNSGADFVLSGRGEGKLLHVLSELIGKEDDSSVDGHHIDHLPYPAFDLYNAPPYVCVLTSRGCPHRCRYCASHLLNDSYCSRDPNAVVDEIEFWTQKTGVQNVAFYDDALFFQPEEHIIPLLNEIISRLLRCDFHTPNGIHIRGMSEEIAHLMFQAGFKTIRFGLETADEDAMARIGPKTTRTEFVEAVGFLQRAGYSENEIGVYLLAGLPGQKARQVEQSIRFVKDCGARPYLAEYSPIPGTRLWDSAVESSRYDLAREPLFHNNSIFPCEWEEFTRTDLDSLKRLLQ